MFLTTAPIKLKRTFKRWHRDFSRSKGSASWKASCSSKLFSRLLWDTAVFLPFVWG